MAWWGGFPRYVPVAERRAKAKREMEKLRQKGKAIEPVILEARTIAHSFWGKGWCEHLESFSDFENRLPRGRAYVRNGSVCHLEIKAGQIEAIVSGSELYKITIQIEPLKKATWEAVKDKCRGQIGSLLELLQGRLSNQVMAIVSDRQHGLFPQPGEIKLKCSCPDWASMCKHVAAVLYGVGSRLDSRPELLFVLRGVEAAELIAAEVALPAEAAAGEDALAEAGLAELFGIDLETAPTPPVPTPASPIAPPAEPQAAPKPARKLPTKLRRKKRNPTPAKPVRDIAKPAKPLAKKTPRAAKPAPRPAFNSAAPTGATVARLRAQAGLSETKFAARTNVPEKLLKIIQEIDTQGDANLTRLTVLKKWFERPERLRAFAVWVARRAIEQKGKTKGEAAALFREARALLTGVDKLHPELDRSPAQALYAKLRAFQNEFRRQEWGAVRVVHDWNLLLVEKGLEICLGYAVPPSEGYKLAADYCQHYDPHFAGGLNGPSRTKLLKIVRFMNRVEALEDEEGGAIGR